MQHMFSGPHRPSNCHGRNTFVRPSSPTRRTRVRANLATLRDRNGVANYLEVLDAERELFAAEQQTVLTRREQLINAVDLYVALGGGVDTVTNLDKKQ